MEHQNLFVKYFKANTLIIFFVIALLYAVSLSIEFKFIFTDDFYIENIQKIDNNSTPESALYFAKLDRETEWVNYPMILLYILFPAVFIGLSLYVGAVLKEHKLKYKDFFSVALKAQIVFALNYFIGVILKWQHLIDRNLLNINNNYDYQSLLVFLNKKKLPQELFYPLQSVNITEIIHILFLSLGVSYVLQSSYKKALSLTLLFYGLALIFWIVFTVFLQITF